MIRKKKLTIEEQVNHMKNCGIRFTIIDEKTAIDYLTNNTYYFKLKAFAKNYTKAENGAGEYVDLEFAYLVELAKLDMHFRRLILSISLQIEHYLKVSINKHFSLNNDEDGYNIVKKFYEFDKSLKEKNDCNKNCYTQYRFTPHSSPYVKNMIKKYKDDFALWNILEVLTYGDLINFYECYSKLYGSIVTGVSDEEFRNMLFISKLLRNASAHSNCLLNDLKDPVKSKNKNLDNFIAKNISDIRKQARDNNLKKRVVNDFSSLLRCMDVLITSNEVKKHLLDDTKDLIKRAQKHLDYFESNNTIMSVFNFLKKVVDYFYNKNI